MRFGPTSTVMVCDPQLVREVLLDDRTFDKGGPFLSRVRGVAGNGLGTCPHAEHRRQRRLLQPVFHAARLPGYAQTMTEEIAKVSGAWQHGQVLDMREETMAISARCAVETMLGGTLEAHQLGQTLADVRVIVDGLYRHMVIPPPLNLLPTPGNRRFDHARIRLRCAVGSAIDSRRTGASDGGDLLSVLLATRDDPEAGSGDGLSDTELHDQLMTFFIAGAETTANVLAWALYLLAQHPDIEKRVHAEVDAALAGRPVTHADLPRLPLTARVITETLRLWPPGWLLTRTVTADTRLGGRHLPAGNTAICSPYLLHRRADLFEHPDRFDPDRWDPSRPQPPRGAFVPFGSGPRKCIGDTFGMTEGVLALAAITARWRLRPVAGRRVRPALAVFLQPRGLRMCVSARISPPTSGTADAA